MRAGVRARWPGRYYTAKKTEMYTETVRVVSNEDMAGDYSLLELRSARIAAEVKPGQFVHLRVPGPFTLRRPFSVFKARPGLLSILYKSVGQATHAMTRIQDGTELSLIGPLGNGFPAPSEFPVFIAGGFGVAPLYLAAQNCARQGIIFIGGATADDVLCVSDFAELGWQVETATENGTLGRKGLVTDSLDVWRRSTQTERCEMFCCGPDGLLKAVGERGMKWDVKAWLSMDRHMGCGMGACLACVQRTRKTDGSETWARVCKAGPVFECREIIWT